MSRITLPLMEVMYCNALDDITVDTKKTQDLLEQAKANIILAQQRQKKAYDRKHSNPRIFWTGALVLKKDFTQKKRKGGKLDSKYRLQDVYNPANTVARVNGVHLKEYKMPTSNKVRILY